MEKENTVSLVLGHSDLFLGVVVVPPNLLELELGQNPAARETNGHTITLTATHIYSCCSVTITQCSNTYHNQWRYILAEDDIEELQASWTVGCHFIGECNLQLHLRVIALDRRHDLCDVIGEAVREEQDHSVESTHVTDEALVVSEQPTAQPAALNGR